jgi:hypothetical protein
MLGGINELTSKDGGFDGPHESEIQATRTQEGETHDEEAKEKDGRGGSRREPRQERQEEGAKAQSCGQEGRAAQEGCAAQEDGSNQDGTAVALLFAAETAGTGIVLFGAEAGPSAATQAGRAARDVLYAGTEAADPSAVLFGTEAGGTATAQADRAADAANSARRHAHPGQAGGVAQSDAAKAAGIELGRIGLERIVGPLARANDGRASAGSAAVVSVSVHGFVARQRHNRGVCLAVREGPMRKTWTWSCSAPSRG